MNHLSGSDPFVIKERNEEIRRECEPYGTRGASERAPGRRVRGWSSSP